jgi:tRNA-specific 2-thiouridylase
MKFNNSAMLKSMKIAMLISGGVDSSVALKLLKDQGHDVQAFYLKVWLEDELAFLGNCPWQEDLAYVEQTCKQLDVPYEVLSVQREYWDQIVSYVIDQVRRGLTPNPDVLCNRYIKFGVVMDQIGDQFDKIATGHYAQVQERDGIAYLLTSPDVVKDQTYFLSHMTQEQLKKALFPIGHLTKAEVRELAHQFGLPTETRKDSQGICFLGKISFAEFIRHHLGERVGDLVEYETGIRMGAHKGFWFYTIGQRQGLGLAGGPWYVVSKNIANNIVYISRNYYAVDKSRDEFDITQCNWGSGIRPEEGQDIMIKLRHGPQAVACSVRWLSSDRARIKLSVRDQGIAAGQFAVFYQNNVCLGSGVITPVAM